MSVTRWDPWREMMSLRQAMDQLLCESFVRPQFAGLAGPSLLLDVVETDDAYLATAVLPGARPEDITLQIQGDTLQIRAEIKSEATPERQRGRWLLRERQFGQVQRTVTLPSPVQADQTEASYEHGVLTIRLPKVRETRPRTIEIRSAGGQPIEARADQTS